MALGYVSQPSRALNEPQKFQGHHPLFEDRSDSSFSEKLSVISSKDASKSSSVHLGGHGMRKFGRPYGLKNKLKGRNHEHAKPGRPVGRQLKKGLQIGSFPAEGLGAALVGHPGTGLDGGRLQRGPFQGSFTTKGLGDALVGPLGTGPEKRHLQRGPLQGAFPNEVLRYAPAGPPGTGPVGGHFQRGPLQRSFPTEGHGGTNFEQKTPTGVANYPYRSPHGGQLMTHGGQFMAHGGQKMPLRDAQMLHRGQPIPNGGYPKQHGGLSNPRGDLVSPIQRMLDENDFLIRTISDFQIMGRNEETLLYQSMLHKNLMYLTGLPAEI